MNIGRYKTTIVHGVKYRYLRVVQEDTTRPTLLFCHGWPTTSHTWRHQVSFFAAKGYGLIVPDMLGYGGTEAPDDVLEYAAKKYCDQLIAILDVERVDYAVAIGHDW